MTPLRERMIQDLRLRNYSDRTIKVYVGHVSKYAQYFSKSPEVLNGNDAHRYLVYLREEKEVSISTFCQVVSALRFCYETTLKREWMLKHLPYPKRENQLPEILSREEVGRLLGVVRKRRDYVMLAVLYDTAIRVSELVKLKLSDIDSERMVIYVRQAKGRKDRFVRLSNCLLEQLRQYWLEYRPKTWLFPSRRHPGEAVGISVVQKLCKGAAKEAKIEKRVYPHLIRHTSATHMVETETDLRTVQMVLGHVDIRQTARYVHISNRHLQKIRSPLEVVAGVK